MPFFRMLKNGMGLSFVALFDNICVVVSGFEVVFEKARNGPFINGLNNQVYEGRC